MSLIPVDEQESRGRDDDEGARTGSLIGRAVARVRTWVRDGIAAAGGLLGRKRTAAAETATARRQRETFESDASPRKVVTTTDPVLHDTERNRADIRVDTTQSEVFTHPPEDEGDNQPRPVATVENDRLELALPDNDAASITSDVWERVER